MAKNVFDLDVQVKQAGSKGIGMITSTCITSTCITSTCITSTCITSTCITGQQMCGYTYTTSC